MTAPDLAYVALAVDELGQVLQLLQDVLVLRRDRVHRDSFDVGRDGVRRRVLQPLDEDAYVVGVRDVGRELDDDPVRSGPNPSCNVETLPARTRNLLRNREI